MIANMERRRLPAISPDPRAVALAAVAVFAALLPGLAMTAGAGVAALTAVLLPAMLFAMRWRRGVLLLLVVLPFAGVPVFVAGTAGLAFRDLAVVLPMYAGFALYVARAGDVRVPRLGLALPALAVFAMLVVAYVPLAPSLAVGVLGAKVWLAYLPMLVIGYHYVRSAEDFECVLRITALLGLVPATIAIAEFVYTLSSGGFGPFAAMYGQSGTEAVRFGFGGEHDAVSITRIPATFTWVTQYLGFALVAYAAGLSMLLRRRSAGWLLCVALLAAGAFASGARAAYLVVPTMTVLALCLAGVRPSRLVAPGFAACGVLGLALLAEPGLVTIARYLPGHVQVSLSYAWRELSDSALAIGNGTGWDTNAALRYGGASERRFIENWYAKTLLELGVAGFVAIVVALGSMLATLLGRLRAAHDDVRTVAAPVCALLAVVVVLLFKGSYIDVAPLNVYFWLLAGMLAGLFEQASRRCAIEEVQA